MAELEKENKGKVWLVGAGPGDAELLTLRGRHALDAADTVVYDWLVSEELLCSLPKSARLICVGKRAGRHLAEQEEINQILIKEANAGHRVVRLKGGDPFVFGRGGEELAALKKAGVPFEVVPGITSALSVPAYAGIPVTHRGVSGCVHILTWHTMAGLKPGTDVLQALAKAGGTIVILMGARAVKEIGETLLSAGYLPDIPAVIVTNGTTARQNTVYTTLSGLINVEITADSPAIIVVGDVCSLGKELSWAQFRPLDGVRIVVTRPNPKNGAFCEKIRALGGEAIPFPCIATVPCLSAESVGLLKNAGNYPWLVFTSAAGVGAFFEQYKSAGLDYRSLAACRFAVIGPSTAVALSAQGFRHDFMPDIFDARSLGKGLVQKLQAQDSALLVRASKGTPALPEILAASGISFTELAVYNTVSAAENRFAFDLIKNGSFDYITFTSPSTVRSFADAFPDMDYSDIHAVCIGAPTAREAASRGMGVTVAPCATEEGICEALTQLLQQERKY